jgi:hypothetical protein
VLHPSDLDGSSGGGGSRSNDSDNPTGSKQGPAANIQQVLDLMQQLRKLQTQQRRPINKQQQLHQQQQFVVRLVSDEWLDAVLSAGQYVPEQPYSLERLLESPDDGNSSSDDDSDDEDRQPASSRAAKKHRQQQQQQQRLVGPRHMPDLDPSPDAPMGK